MLSTGTHRGDPVKPSRDPQASVRMRRLEHNALRARAGYKLTSGWDREGVWTILKNPRMPQEHLDRRVREIWNLCHYGCRDFPSIWRVAWGRMLNWSLRSETLGLCVGWPVRLLLISEEPEWSPYHRTEADRDRTIIHEVAHMSQLEPPPHTPVSAHGPEFVAVLKEFKRFTGITPRWGCALAEYERTPSTELRHTAPTASGAVIGLCEACGRWRTVPNAPPLICPFCVSPSPGTEVGCPA